MRTLLALTLAASAAAFGTHPTPVDHCGVPHGNNDCVDHCGVPHGNNDCVDQCGVPHGNNECVDQCGVPHGTDDCVDECGVPYGDNNSCLDNFGVVNGGCVCATEENGCTSNGVDVSSEGRCFCGVHVAGYSAFCYIVDGAACADSMTTQRYGSNPEASYKFDCTDRRPSPPPAPPSEPTLPPTELGAGKCRAMTASSNSYTGMGYGNVDACLERCGENCHCFSVNEATDSCEIATGQCYLRCDGEVAENAGWTAYKPPE